MEKEMVHCYNRGCGKKFDPRNNNDEDCIYHSEAPVFHDAYKIWPCCNKKSINFSEFLNIKGCTKSVHSNEKPPEPEKPVKDKTKSEEIIEVHAQPILNKNEERPSFDVEQTVMTPFISAALEQQVKELIASKSNLKDDNVIKIGQSCKHSSCKATYSGPESNNDVCVYHPGVPVFHEGMKYWSCCQKKTTDFSVFLAQPGCSEDRHLWVSQDSNKKITQCRMDWHQTGNNIVISIYAKKYLPQASQVKLSPVRLTVQLYFPEGDSKYDLDIELSKVIDVDKSKVSMYPSKLEITLVKTSPEHWKKLEIPRTSEILENANEKYEDTISAEVNSVDLSDL